MGVRLSHLAFGAAAAIFPWTVATSAWAQTYSVNVDANLPDIGEVATPNSGTTTFRVTPSTGVISRTGGTGVLVHNGVTTRGLVHVGCTGSNSGCDNHMKVVITRSGSPTSPMSTLTNFTVAMNSATLIGSAPAAASSITFTLDGVGRNNTETFYVGMDIPVVSSGTDSGAGHANWIVTVSTTSGGSSENDTSTAKVSTFRPISVSKSADLVFGKIVRPSTGSGTLSIDGDGNFTAPGDGYAVDAHHPATFIVKGEGGQGFNLNMPSTFKMTAGAGKTLTFDLIGSDSYTLGSTLGNSGTATIGVGASTTVSSSTLTGNYSGSFTVTAVYN